MFSVSSSRCSGLVYSVGLWYFLIILNYFLTGTVIYQFRKKLRDLFWSIVKPVLNGHYQKDQNWFSRPLLSLNLGQKYCRMLQWEHSAILSTFIKLPIVIRIFVFSIFEWPPKTGFTVCRLPDIPTQYSL